MGVHGVALAGSGMLWYPPRIDGGMSSPRVRTASHMAISVPTGRLHQLPLAVWRRSASQTVALSIIGSPRGRRALPAAILIQELCEESLMF